MRWCGQSRVVVYFFIKQKTAYEMRMSDWSSDVCSTDLIAEEGTESNGAQINAILPNAFGRLPYFQKPTHLLFPRAPMMHFSNGQRNGVALPYFFQALG